MMMESLSRRAAAVPVARIERGATPTNWSFWPPNTVEVAGASGDEGEASAQC